MSDSAILTQIDTAILRVVTAIASGDPIIEYREGPLHVKKNTSKELLETLREMKREYTAGASTDRQAAVCYSRGAV